MATSWEDPPEYRPESSGMPQVGLPRLTPGTRWLLIANTAVLAVTFLLFLAASDAWRAVADWLGLQPRLWRDLAPFVPVWQLFTYGFLHSVENLLHLLMNMLMLYFFGTMLEGMIGTRRFLLAYLSAQLVGALFFLVPGILSGSSVPVIGASGAVFGIMIAAATLRPRQLVVVLFVPVTLGVLAIVLVAITLFNAALQLKGGGGGGVAHLVHLGGIVYGFLAVKTGILFADPVTALERSRKIRAFERHKDDEKRVDLLLDKINREGMSALSKRERAFLKRVSSRR